MRHRTEDIIGFEAFHLKAGDIKGIHQLADAVDLRAQVSRHLGAGGFISRENLIPEGFAGIEGNRQVIRFFLLENADQLARKAVGPRGRLAFGVLPTGGWTRLP